MFGKVKLTVQLDHSSLGSALTSSSQELPVGSLQLLDLGLGLLSGSYGSFQFRDQVSYTLILNLANFLRVSGILTCSVQALLGCFEISL